MARRLGVGLLIVLAVLLLVIVGAFALAQTAPGQRLIARGVERALSSDGASAEVSGLGGFFPFDLHLDRVALRDEAGVWLKLEGLAFDWAPSELLDGRLAIRTLAARRIELVRLPPGEGEPPAPDSDEPFRLPELPDVLPLVTLDRLAVDEFVLGKAVAGEAARFSLSGAATTIDRGRGVELVLDLDRTDQATAGAKLAATLALEPPTLNLDLEVRERGRLVESLAGIEESGDFSLQLVGNGPLRAWRGELTGGGAGLGTLAATVTLGLTEQPQFGFQAAIEPAPAVVPGELAGLIGERVGIDLDVTQMAAQTLRIDRLNLDAAEFALATSGTVDFDQQVLDVEAAVTVRELERLAGLAGMPLSGALEAKLRAAGPFLQPHGRLELAGETLEVAGVRSGSVALGADFEALGPLDQALAAAISLSGEVQGLETEAAPALPPRDLTLALDARWQPGEPLRIETLTLADGNVDLAADGTVDPETFKGDVQVRLAVEALRPLLEPFGQPVEGALTLAADVGIAPSADRIEVGVEGALRELAGLPPGAAEVLGEQAKIALALDFRPDQALDVARLSIEAAHATLTGEGALRLPDGAVDAELRLALTSLDALQPVAGTELAGEVVAHADVSGTLEAPRVDLEVRGDDLLLAGRPVERLALTTEVAGLEPLAGKLNLQLSTSGIETALATSYRLQGEGLLLDPVKLTGPGIELGGKLRADLGATLIDGTLKGSVADLARLDPLLPVPLAGRIALETRFSPKGGQQNVDLTLNAQEFRGAFGRLERATLAGTVANLLGKPRVDGTLTLTDFRQEATRVDQLQVSARGPLSDLDLAVAANGTAELPFRLESQLNLALAEATRVRLEALSGTVAGQALQLRQPATLSLEGPSIQLTGLDLRFAGGRLEAALALSEGPVSGKVQITNLPLANLEPLGAPALAGRATGSIELDGTATDPRLQLTLRVPDLRGTDATLADVPPLDVTINSSFAEQRLAADLRASGLTDQPITGRVALPVAFTLQPLAFNLPDDGALSGALNAEVRLRRVADLLALDGQRLEGLLVAELDLGGTLAAPVPDGSVRISNGLYENGTTGTVLRNLTLRAEANAERFAIRELSATDGGSGRISGSGRIEIDGERAYPLAMQVRLNDATLLRRDDLQASVGGTLRLEGDLNRSDLRGRITVERAEIGIPEAGGPSVAVLDVEEVGGGYGQRVEPADDAADPGMTIGLNVVVEVPGQVYVRGRGLESEWQGRLRVEGTADDPKLLGDLSIKRGAFDFLDRRFDLREGQISFTGAVPPEPDIMVEAVAETGDMTAIVRASGPPDDLEITLSSEPELPEDEVLSRLLFKRDVSQISAAEAASLALAVNRLRGGSGGLDVLGQARKALGVDTLDVGGAQGQEVIRAGKYIGDDVYVEVEKGRADESGRARVELEVLPNVSIEAETGEDATSGVGLKWKYDY